MASKREKEILQLRQELHASTDVIVADTLNKIEKSGDASLIPDMIEVWDKTDSATIKKSIESILYALKSSAALDVLVNTLDKDFSDEMKGLALSAIWQSGFSASTHLSKLVDVALTGSYTNAIDVMSIVEASEFDEDQEELIDQNLIKIKEQLLANKPETAPIVLEIKSILIDKKIEG